MSRSATSPRKGRVTGQPHEIEIWYVEHEGSLYLMAGGGHMADWVKNMKADAIRLGQGRRPRSFPPLPKSDPDERRLRRSSASKMAAEYQGWEEGAELSNWARNPPCL